MRDFTDIHPELTEDFLQKIEENFLEVNKLPFTITEVTESDGCTALHLSLDIQGLSVTTYLFDTVGGFFSQIPKDKFSYDFIEASTLKRIFDNERMAHNQASA